MPDTIDPELCFITMTSQKLSIPLSFFGLKLFHGFVILGGKMEPIACLVFYLVIKMLENLSKKPYRAWQTIPNMANSSKNIKKTSHQNVPIATHKKRQILFHRFLDEYK